MRCCVFSPRVFRHIVSNNVGLGNLAVKQVIVIAAYAVKIDIAASSGVNKDIIQIMLLEHLLDIHYGLSVKDASKAIGCLS